MKRLWGERVIQLCLVQVLDYEAQTTKKKKVLECAKCPVRKSCAKWVKENEENNRDKNTIPKSNRGEDK